jgi:pentatricopeptide repeat protein
MNPLIKHLIAILTVSLLVAGCGKKGPMVSPDALIPSPVNDLKLSQRGESLQASWSIHDIKKEGDPSKALEAFRLMRREVLPPDEDCESCPNAYQVVKEVFLDYPQDARRIGDQIFVSDSSVINGKTYQYKVVSYMRDGTPSNDSNKFRIEKVVPPPSVQLSADPSPTSIILSWKDISVSGMTKVTGYNLYRWRTNESPAVVPLNGTPLQTTVYEDFRLERGVGYTYCVRSLADAGGTPVEGPASNEVRASLSEPD